MKIGFSFSKCLRDILDGNVREQDVVCIIARTSMDREHLEDVVRGYMGSHSRTLKGVDYNEAVDLARRLWDDGKIHQPSQFNKTRVVGVANDFVWMDLAPTRNSDNENVVKAWDNYQLMLKMCEGRTPDGDDARRNVMEATRSGF